MAVSDVEISGETAAEWADCFYGLLRQGRRSSRRSHYPVANPMLRYERFGSVTSSSFLKGVILQVCASASWNQEAARHRPPENGTSAIVAVDAIREVRATLEHSPDLGQRWSGSVVVEQDGPADPA